MTKEKQIDEMAEHCFYNEEGNCCVDLHKSVMCEDEAKTCAIYQTLENIYIAGYRKQSDIINEFVKRLKEEPIKLSLPLFGLSTKDEIEEHFNDIMLEVRDAIDRIAKEILEENDIIH